MKEERKIDLLEIVIYAFIGFVILYFVSGFGACLQLNTDSEGQVDLVKAVNSYDKILLDKQGIIDCLKTKGTCLKLSVICVFGELIFALAKVTSQQKLHRKGQEHGSSHWATAKDKKALADVPSKRKLSKMEQQQRKENIKRLKAEKKYIPDYNAIITKDIKMSIDQRQTRKNLNMCIIGNPGTGKSRYVVKPNIMQANTSYVVTDPKGELLRSTGKFLSEQGYEVKVFNLIDMKHSCNYNPFNYIYDVYGNYSEAAVIKMINVLMTNTKKEGSSGGDQFWDDSTELLLSALCFYLIEVEDEEKRNFSSVMQLLKMAEVKEGEEDFQSDLDLIFDCLEHPEKYDNEESKKTDKYAELGFDKIISNDKSPSDYMCLKYYKDFKKAAGDTLKSIIISVAVRLKAFNLPNVIDLTCCDNLDLGLIGDKKTALFILIPSSDNTFNFLAAMMYTQLFDSLYDRANFKHGGRLPVHVRCILDEFRNIGKIPRFPELLATMRSMEISATIIIQNFPQLKEMYKDDWENLLSCCDSMLFLGGNDTFTLEYLSKRLDKETIDTISRSRSKGKNSSTSSNDGILGRELMTVGEMGMMPDSDCIFLVRGLRPFYSKKYIIEKHPNFKYLEDYDKSNAFEINDLITQSAVKEDLSEDLTTEPIFEDDVVNDIKNILSEGKSFMYHDEDDIPTEVEETTIGSGIHTPLVTENTKTEFNSMKAEVNEGDTPFSVNNSLDSGLDEDDNEDDIIATF